MKADKYSEIPLNQTPEVYWQHHLDACSASGWSKFKYCRHHQINYDQMRAWHKKLKKVNPTPLVQVKIKSEPVILSEQPICTLVLPGGYALKIHDEKALSLVLDKWR
jgi:hypothetical protein